MVYCLKRSNIRGKGIRYGNAGGSCLERTEVVRHLIVYLKLGGSLIVTTAINLLVSTVTPSGSSLR